MIDRLIDEEAVRTSPIHFGLVMTELGSLRSVQCPSRTSPKAVKGLYAGVQCLLPGLAPAGN